MLINEKEVRAMGLSQRKRMILKAIIDEYINTGAPVGSRTLSKREEIDISSATIRNEMADLEEMGYLYSPHTSSGRQPTDLAYRLYVDELLKKPAVDEKEMEFVKNYMESGSEEITSLMNKTAKLLSDTTHLTSVVLAPQISELTVSRIQIVKITGHRLLLLIIFNDGTVKDLTVPSHGWNEDDVDAASDQISKRVRGKTLPEAYRLLYDDIPEEYSAQRDILKNVMETVDGEAIAQKDRRLILGGANNIFDHPEYKDVDSAKNFLQLLETRQPLYEMLSKATEMEFTIKIGKENDIDELKNMSVVTATYKVGDKNLGSFGVIGPTRMDYAKVLSVLSCVGKSMNEIMQCYITADDKEDD